MLFLSFHIGSEQYAVTATQVLEILPLTSTKRIPHAPAYISGLLDYRGNPVPVINLCQLIENRTHHPVLSSRIILVNYIAVDTSTHYVGLVAEKVTETIKIDLEKFTSSGVSLPDAPYLGPLTNSNGRMTQLINVNTLLPREVQLMLFQEPAYKQSDGHL